LSRISEFEPLRRDEERRARKPWPGSAWFALGTMVVLNLFLIAFVVENELNRPEPAEASTPTKIDVPKIEPRPGSQTLHTPQPDQMLNPQVAEPDATKTDSSNPDTQNPDDQDRENQAPHFKPSPGTSKALHNSKAGNTRRFATAPAHARVTPKHYSPEPAPQSRFATPQIPTSRMPASVPAIVAGQVPPPNSGAIAPQAAGVASTIGVGNQTVPHQKLMVPAAGGTASTKPKPTLDPNAGQNQKREIRVASVGLPGMDKGLVIFKTPEGSTSPKIEVLHRPPPPKVDVPNCGGDVQIPCPTLKKRPAGGSPDGDRW